MVEDSSRDFPQNYEPQQDFFFLGRCFRFFFRAVLSAVSIFVSGSSVLGKGTSGTYTGLGDEASGALTVKNDWIEVLPPTGVDDGIAYDTTEFAGTGIDPKEPGTSWPFVGGANVTEPFVTGEVCCATGARTEFAINEFVGCCVGLALLKMELEEFILVTGSACIDAIENDPDGARCPSTYESMGACGSEPCKTVLLAICTGLADSRNCMDPNGACCICCIGTILADSRNCMEPTFAGSNLGGTCMDPNGA